MLFNKAKTTLMQCPGGAIGVYAVPTSVTNINGWAFYGCRKLVKVTIPQGVRSIGTWAFDSCLSLTNLHLPSTVTAIGDTAFRNCASLGAITVDAANPAYRSVDGVLFDRNLTLLIQCPARKQGTYHVPDNVTTIADWAFANCLDLTKITVSRNVIYIGESAFWGCPNLSAFFFQGNPPNHGSDLFGADGPPVIYYLPNSAGWPATYSGKPTVLWHAMLQATTPTAATNGFSFTITGTSNIVVILEACTNLLHPTWLAVGTNSLLNGSSEFTDPDSMSFHSRFYRLRDP